MTSGVDAGLRSPIYLKTIASWYIIGSPASEYRPRFAPFFRAHNIAQVFVCTLIREPHTDLEVFIVELQFTESPCLHFDLGKRLGEGDVVGSIDSYPQFSSSQPIMVLHRLLLTRQCHHFFLLHSSFWLTHD